MIMYNMAYNFMVINKKMAKLPVAPSSFDIMSYGAMNLQTGHTHLSTD